MTREQQISDAARMCDLCGNLHDLDCFVAGAEWADKHAIISKDNLKQLIDGVESGRAKVVSEYSNNADALEAYRAGQMAALRLLIEWIDYNESSKFD